jgi:hypothetical protein
MADEEIKEVGPTVGQWGAALWWPKSEQCRKTNTVLWWRNSELRLKLTMAAVIRTRRRHFEIASLYPVIMRSLHEVNESASITIAWGKK